MDKYQTQDREATIRNAIKSAISYLEKHPKRSVSLMLSNAVTVSKIVLLDCSGSTTYTATVIDNGGFKSLTVSLHDIVAVSEDDADLVTDDTREQRQKEIIDFIMQKFDEGEQSSFFVQQQNRALDDLITIGQKYDSMSAEQRKALFDAHLRENVVIDVTLIVERAYRPYTDFVDMRAHALTMVGLSRFI